jgi:hypothetical protein
MSDKLTFMLAIKSTLDTLMVELAAVKSVPYLDLDDTTKTPDVLGKNEPALIGEFGTLEESPIDPLYNGSVRVGARTCDDPANYKILELAGTLNDKFSRGSVIPIFEMFGSVPGPKVGTMTITSTEVVEQNYDVLSNFRLMNVTFRAQRLI